MITNPNTVPVKTQNNLITTPKTTGMVANNEIKQNSSVTVKPTATVVKQSTFIPKTSLTSQTRITVGTALPQNKQTVPMINNKQETANEALAKVTTQKPVTTPQTNRFVEVSRPNGTQVNKAMPHQGKADQSGVKFVGVETMPKTNDNTTTQGYALITQVPAKSYGVDVSNYQETDLSPYARQGAKFAIVKLTEGTGYINPYAAGQIASAKANNMLAMGYVFAHSGGNTAKAKQEAEYGIAEAQRAGLPKRSYIAYDYEVGASGSVSANTTAIETFMQTVLQAGYLPLLYSGNAYLHAHVDVNKITNDYKGSLWVASYPTTGATSTPNWNYFPSNPGVAIWQFTDNWKGMNVDGDVATLPLNDGSSASLMTNTTPASTINTNKSNVTKKPTSPHASSTTNVQNPDNLPLPDAVKNGNFVDLPKENGDLVKVKVDAVFPNKIDVPQPTNAKIINYRTQKGASVIWLVNSGTNSLINQNYQSITFNTPVQLPIYSTPQADKDLADKNLDHVTPAIKQLHDYNQAQQMIAVAKAVSAYYQNAMHCPQGMVLDTSKGINGVIIGTLDGSPYNSHGGKTVYYINDYVTWVYFKAKTLKPTSEQPAVTQKPQPSAPTGTVTVSPDIPKQTVTQPQGTNVNGQGKPFVKSQIGSPVMPNIHIDISANANAQAKANANANVKVNNNTSGESQTGTYGLGSVLPSQMTHGKFCNSSIIGESDTPVTVTNLSIVSDENYNRVSSPVTMPVTVSPSSTTSVMRGQENIMMPATGQEHSRLLPDLAAVAIAALGASRLLDKRNN